jgi:hypothetical protein
MLTFEFLMLEMKKADFNSVFKGLADKGFAPQVCAVSGSSSLSSVSVFVAVAILVSSSWHIVTEGLTL